MKKTTHSTRLFLILFSCTAILLGCASEEIIQEMQNPIFLEDDLTHYGEFEIVESATVQRFLNKESTLIKEVVQIVRDPVTGCMYISNNSPYLSLTPIYDEKGEVKGCGGNINEENN